MRKKWLAFCAIAMILNSAIQEMTEMKKLQADETRIKILAERIKNNNGKTSRFIVEENEE